MKSFLRVRTAALRLPNFERHFAIVLVAIHDSIDPFDTLEQLQVEQLLEMKMRFSCDTLDPSIAAAYSLMIVNPPFLP